MSAWSLDGIAGPGFRSRREDADAPVRVGGYALDLLVEADTRCQSALGDAVSGLEPLRGHGGRLPLDEGDQGASWEVHRILASAEEGRVPVAAEEKAEAIRELADDHEAVAAQVATDFLHCPEVAFGVMRENMNEAQFERAGLDAAEFEENSDQLHRGQRPRAPVTALDRARGWCGARQLSYPLWEFTDGQVLELPSPGGLMAFTALPSALPPGNERNRPVHL